MISALAELQAVGEGGPGYNQLLQHCCELFRQSAEKAAAVRGSLLLPLPPAQPAAHKQRLAARALPMLCCASQAGPAGAQSLRGIAP